MYELSHNYVLYRNVLVGSFFEFKNFTFTFKFCPPLGMTTVRRGLKIEQRANTSGF